MKSKKRRKRETKDEFEKWCDTFLDGLCDSGYILDKIMLDSVGCLGKSDTERRDYFVFRKGKEELRVTLPIPCAPGIS